MLNFKGTARVRLSQLMFSNPIRPIDSKIVKALKRDFRAEGCLQHETDCSVPAILNETSLASALEGLNVNAKSFKATSVSSPAKFQFPSNIQLECLHGQHRIYAATEYLPPGDRWWLVDIYGQGLDETARQLFKEGHSYSTNFSDGEIFRQVRLCQFNGDRVGEDRWRARITSNKEKLLVKLLKRGLLITALDSILPIRGIWNDFHFGSLDIVLSIRCDESRRILGDQGSLLQYVDQHTVEMAQLRAPRVSKMDSEFFRQKMLSRDLFPGIQDPTVRAGIEQRLLEEDQLIPSLYKLIKDLRYLEPAAKAVQALLPERMEGSLRQRFRFLFSSSDIAAKHLEIQDSEISYSTVSGDFNVLFDLAYRELFLCAMRYFISLSNISSKKDMNPIQQTANATKRYLGFKLMELAHRLGFSVKKIEGILEDPSERLLADFLRGLPKEIFEFKGGISQRLSDNFKEYLASSTIAADSHLMPAITTVGLGEPLSQRCGRCCGGPLDDDDRRHLFLRKMHAPLSDFPGGGYDISSFYVKRSIYLAFFGPTQIPGTRDRPGAPEVQEENVESSMAEPNNANEDLRQDPREPAMASGAQEESVEPTTSNGTHGVYNGSYTNTGTTADQLLTSPRLISRRNSILTADRMPPSAQPTLQVQEYVNPELLAHFVNKSGSIIKQVLFTRESVDKEALEMASRGLSLIDERGIYHIWYTCYDALIETETRRIIVEGTIRDHVSIEDIQSGMHKRRGSRLIGNRISESDLIHKASSRQATVEDEEEL